MSLFKKMSILAAAGTAVVTLSAPAQAAISVTFPVGATSGAFSDTDIAPGAAYDQSASVFFSKAGKGTFTISAVTSAFDITNAYFNGVAFKFIPDEEVDFGKLTNQVIKANTSYLLRIVGTGAAPAGESGSFAGTIKFTASAVPEPASWALMIGGFGIAGGAMRRRARKTEVAFA